VQEIRGSKMNTEI